MSKIDWSKPLQTRDGREVTIVTRCGRGAFPVLYYIGDNNNLEQATKDGYYCVDGIEDSRDIVNKSMEMVKYLNVYENGDIITHNTRSNADHAVGPSSRIACIKVVIRPGQFDN